MRQWESNVPWDAIFPRRDVFYARIYGAGLLVTEDARFPGTHPEAVEDVL